MIKPLEKYQQLKYIWKYNNISRINFVLYMLMVFSKTLFKFNIV
jgi:hypothetical protein